MDPSDEAGAAEPLTEADLIRWSESLAGIARTGLAFTENGYERERYEEVLRVAADIRAASRRTHDPDALVDEWLAQVGDGVAGYVTPKIAIGAVVGNDEGQILLIRRADSGLSRLLLPPAVSRRGSRGPAIWPCFRGSGGRGGCRACDRG